MALEMSVTTEGQDHQRSVELPSTQLQRSLATAWSQVLGSTVHLDTNFFDSGGTSMDGLDILDRTKELVGTEFPLSVLVQHPTVRKMAEFLDGHTEKLRWTNLVEVKPEGKGAPVVCVHGDEANYHFSRLLPSEHPFLAFFHQGEDGQAMAHRTFPSIAAHYAKELQEACPKGPLVICGYSYGGVIALELAHRLKEAGREVPLLVVLDSRSPSTFRKVTAKSVLLRLRDVMDRAKCARWFAKGMPLPDDLRNFYIMDIYGAAMRDHLPKPWAGPALLVRSTGRSARPHGWDDILTNLRTVVVPGDHKSIITAAGLAPIVKAITEEMGRLAI